MRSLLPPTSHSLRNEARRLVVLSVPAMVTQAGIMLLGVVDTLMVGHLGGDALGAASLGHLWTLVTSIFGLGVVFGIDPLVAQAHGRGDGPAMGAALQRGCVVAVLLSVPMALLWFLTEPCLVLLGQDPELSRKAASYAIVQVPSLPFFFLFYALRQYLQCRGITFPPLLVVAAGNLLNVLLNWWLIYGVWVFPSLGVTGAGLATGLTRTFLMLSLLGLMWLGRLHEGGWQPWSAAAFRPAGLLEVLRHGVPVGVQYSLEIWAFQIATLFAGWLGAAELGAHTIVLNMASLSFMLPLGISIGAVTRVGNLIGERRRHRAQLAAWLAMAMGAGVMGFSAVLFVALRRQLPWLYSSDAPILEAAAAILPIAGAFQLLDGTQVVGGGVLRGMGRTRPAAVFNLLGYYVLALPFSYWLCFPAGYGLVGIWWGLCIGLGAVALSLLVWIWCRGPGFRRDAADRVA